MSVVAQTLGVSRSQPHARLAGRAEPRRRDRKAGDATVVPLIAALVAARPTYGSRRITALLNRQLRAAEAAPVNHKRVTASCRRTTCSWRGATRCDPTTLMTARS